MADAKKNPLELQTETIRQMSAVIAEHSNLNALLRIVRRLRLNPARRVDMDGEALNDRIGRATSSAQELLGLHAFEVASPPWLAQVEGLLVTIAEKRDIEIEQ